LRTLLSMDQRLILWFLDKWRSRVHVLDPFTCSSFLWPKRENCPTPILILIELFLHHPFHLSLWSLVKDPWMGLQPIIGFIIYTLESFL
jgi:hypothetical protein